MAHSPYRAPERPEPTADPEPSHEMSIVLAFVWLVTLLRVIASFGLAEPLSQSLVFAWVVLIVAPYLLLQQTERWRRR